MTQKSRTRFISDVDVTQDNVVALKPLVLSRDNNRRYVRLTISSPIAFSRIKDIFGNFTPECGDYPIDGTILNISEGGLLAEMDEPLNEGDIVAMRIIMEKVEPLEGVLGLVKRCDHEDECNLVGIQFVRREELIDQLSQGEIELLSDRLDHFDQTVRLLLNRYLRVKQAQA
jgi:hypothetical protein